MQKNNKPAAGPSLTERFAADPDRADALSLRLGPLLADFSRRAVGAGFPEKCASELADTAVPGAVRALFDGAPVNASEARPALHWACRAESAPACAGRSLNPLDDERFTDLVSAFQAGRAWDGAARPFTDVVCLGIGGSELGPRLVVEALAPASARRAIHFHAGLDPRALDELLARLDPARTLVVVTSKSFATAETLENARAARDWLAGAPGEAAADHMVAVTARGDRAREFGVSASRILDMPESVGGRFSLWSAAGLPAALAIGEAAFGELLAGAHAMDVHFREAPAGANLPLLLGALDRGMAVVPYDERLALLPAYLQQLYMESLGKSVDASGAPLPGFPAPLVFGATGTGAQHAFFQALHQGNLDLPVEFVGVVRGPGQGEARNRLLANLLAQASALAFGRDADAVRKSLGSDAGATDVAHRVCPGDRESNVLLLDELTPYALGMLLAHYEHRVFVAAARAGVNPFDQFGVELGKHLAGDIEKAMDGEAASLPPGIEGLLDRLRDGGAKEN